MSQFYQSEPDCVIHISYPLNLTQKVGLIFILISYFTVPFTLTLWENMRINWKDKWAKRKRGSIQRVVWCNLVPDFWNGTHISEFLCYSKRSGIAVVNNHFPSWKKKLTDNDITYKLYDRLKEIKHVHDIILPIGKWGYRTCRQKLMKTAWLWTAIHLRTWKKKKGGSEFHLHTPTRKEQDFFFSYTPRAANHIFPHTICDVICFFLMLLITLLWCIAGFVLFFSPCPNANTHRRDVIWHHTKLILFSDANLKIIKTC